MPMYVGEIAPLKYVLVVCNVNGLVFRYRGSLGTLHQLAIVTGILASQLLGLPLSQPTLWRILFALTCVPSLVQLVLLPFCVETPRYLVSQARVNASKAALVRLRASPNILMELECIIASQEKELLSSDGSSLNIFQLCASKTYRKALIVAITAQLSQQLCGINGVIQYSTSIFEALFGDFSSTMTVLVGVVNLVMTIISLILIERAGRRVLFLSSQTGVFIFSIIIVLSSVYRVDVLTAVGGTKIEFQTKHGIV